MSFVHNSLRFFGSFSREQMVQCYRSNVGPNIEVALINGRYQINAGNVNYSYGSLHDAFRRYFNLDPPPSGAELPVLILGFGGGSVATILRNERLMPNPITGVEVDEAMIQAGKEHFGIDKIQNLELLCMDAWDFTRQCKASYALVIVDLYINENVPDQFESREFLKAVSKCLAPGGKLVFNKLSPIIEPSQSFIELEKQINILFGNSKTYRVGVNKKIPNFMITAINNDANEL